MKKLKETWNDLLDLAVPAAGIAGMGCLVAGLWITCISVPIIVVVCAIVFTLRALGVIQ